MGHLLILFPLLILIGWAMHRSYRKDPQNLYAYHFRNFTWIWSLCTLIGAASVVFWGTPFAKTMGAALSIPGLYVATGYLVRLPFRLYNKPLVLPNLLTALIVTLGVFIGSLFLVKAFSLFGNLGPLEAFYKTAFGQAKNIRLWIFVLIFVPLGIFFISEAAKSVSARIRLRASLIGLGTIIIGIFEGLHAFTGAHGGALNFAYPDLLVPFGFFLVLGGLFYGREKVAVGA